MECLRLSTKQSLVLDVADLPAVPGGAALVSLVLGAAGSLLVCPQEQLACAAHQLLLLVADPFLRCPCPAQLWPPIPWPERGGCGDESRAGAARAVGCLSSDACKGPVAECLYGCQTPQNQAWPRRDVAWPGMMLLLMLGGVVWVWDPCNYLPR